MKKLLTLSNTCQRISRESHYQDPEIVQRQLRRHARKLSKEAHKHHRGLKLLSLANAIGSGLKELLPYGKYRRKSSKKVPHKRTTFPGGKQALPSPCPGAAIPRLGLNKPHSSYD